MHKRLLLVPLLLAFASSSRAQAKSVYFEILGPGIASFNFDTRFTRTEGGLGARVGIGGFSVDGDGIVTFPLGLNYLLGNDRRYFELGAGATPVIGTGGIDDFNGTFGHLTFGYRMQPQRSGFTFRAAINPLFDSRTFYPLYFGISFGYKF